MSTSKSTKPEDWGHPTAAAGAWTHLTTADWRTDPTTSVRPPIIGVLPMTMKIEIDMSFLLKKEKATLQSPYLRTILSQVPSAKGLLARDLKALTEFLGEQDSGFRYNAEDLYAHDEY